MYADQLAMSGPAIRLQRIFRAEIDNFYFEQPRARQPRAAYIGLIIVASSFNVNGTTVMHPGNPDFVFETVSVTDACDLKTRYASKSWRIFAICVKWPHEGRI